MARRFDIDDPQLAHLLRWVQDGVVSRRQLIELGAGDNDIDRWLRRRELTRVHPGVYVDHTGEPSRAQREWIAVLAAWPAALTRDSALPKPTSQVIHLAVDLSRTVQPPARVAIHRTPRLAERVRWRASPPRVRLEHALVDEMAALVERDDVAGAFATLTQVAFTRQTSARAVLDTLGARSRVPGRTTIEALLRDLRDGACSVLERGYLQRVERRHGLPRGDRQHRSVVSGRTTYQDVRYRRYGVVVELDGRAHHETARARDRDAMRDLAELATGDVVTARVTYGMVFGRECRTAAWVGSVLRRRGWRGQLRPCPDCR